MKELQSFRAIEVTEKIIKMQSKEDLTKMIHLMENGDNFFLELSEGKEKTSTLMISTNLTAKVRNGEILLLAKETEVK